MKGHQRARGPARQGPAQSPQVAADEQDTLGNAAISEQIADDLVDGLAEFELILRTTTFGGDDSRVASDIACANRIWGRTGVRIVEGNRLDIPLPESAAELDSEDILDAPPAPGTDPAAIRGRPPTDPNRLDLFSPGVERGTGRREASGEVHALLAQNQALANLPGNSAADELTAYWLPGFEDQGGPMPGRQGQAFDQQFDAVPADGVAIAAQAEPETLAHEIAHIVLHQDHVDDPQNLLAAGGVREGTEIDSAQRQAMRASPYLHPLDPLPE